MSVARAMLAKPALKRRQGGVQLVQAAIAIMVMIAIGVVVVSLVIGITSQILQNVPQPQPNTLLYNLSRTFDTAVGQGLNLLPAVFMVGFGVLVLGAILYIWAWFSPPAGRGR
jgi:MFS superfamily sulfate permease-like transporter